MFLDKVSSLNVSLVSILVKMIFWWPQMEDKTVCAEAVFAETVCMCRGWMCRGCMYMQRLCVCAEIICMYRGCMYVQRLYWRDYRRHRRTGFDPWVGKIPLGGGNDNPLQYSCLENLMDRGAWWATVQSIAKSQTQLSDWVCSGSLAPEMERFLTRCKLDSLVF